MRKCLCITWNRGSSQCSLRNGLRRACSLVFDAGRSVITGTSHRVGGRMFALETSSNTDQALNLVCGIVARSILRTVEPRIVACQRHMRRMNRPGGFQSRFQLAVATETTERRPSVGGVAPGDRTARGRPVSPARPCRVRRVATCAAQHGIGARAAAGAAARGRAPGRAGRGEAPRWTAAGLRSGA